jgi:hypothetical protein
MSKKLRYVHATLYVRQSTVEKLSFFINDPIQYFPLQMTLWAIARSPLMFGGDVRKLDEITYSLITNPFILEINSYSTNNMEACETMSF